MPAKNKFARLTDAARSNGFASRPSMRQHSAFRQSTAMRQPSTSLTAIREGPSVTGARPRLLALHGARSNNQVTRMQLDNLQINETADVTYLEGPIEVNEGDPDLSELVDGPFFSWLDADSSNVDEAQLVAAVQHVLKTVKEHGERTISPRPPGQSPAPCWRCTLCMGEVTAAAPRSALCPAPHFF